MTASLLDCDLRAVLQRKERALTEYMSLLVGSTGVDIGSLAFMAVSRGL